MNTQAPWKIFNEMRKDSVLHTQLDADCVKLRAVMTSNYMSRLRVELEQELKDRAMWLSKASDADSDIAMLALRATATAIELIDQLSKVARTAEA